MRILCLIAVILLVILGGCTQQSKVWGTGDPPIEWQGYFGNDNMARLNYIQTNTLNSQGQLMAELNERVRKLEDPNKP